MGGFVGEVISFIGRPFGIYTHDETFTDIQISNLLTPGEADKNARKNCKHNSGGDSQLYLTSYKAFQRDYRKKYSAQFMRRQGYAPSSTAYTRVNDEAKTEVYLEGLYGYAAVTVESVKDKYLTVNEKGRHAIQTLTGYDFATGNVIDGGTYILTEYTEDTVDETVVVHMKRDYIESIEDNLYTNYAYDGIEVTVLDEQYTVGVLSSELNVNDEYETVCVHVGGTLPDEIIVTAAERKAYEVTNVAYGTEASYASYRVTSGEVGNELRYWVDLADTRDIYNRANVDITAIIPMKEDNVMVNLENRQLEKMLGKLNLSGEQLKTSIENPDMDGAYLMTGINPQYNDNTTNATLLKIFDYIAEAGANISISISRLSMKYSFGMTKSTVSGSIGPVGTATRVNIPASYSEGNTTQAGMTLRLQVDSNEYREITVTNFSQEYTISGHVLTTHFDSTGGYTRIVIPLDILNGFNYKTFVEVYEKSLCMLAFSVEVVRVQWYETSAFGTILKIVGLILTIFTIFTVGLVMIIVMKAVMQLIMKLAVKLFGPVFGPIVVAIVMILAMDASGAMASMSTVEVWMFSANQALGAVNQIIQHKADELARESADYMDNMQKKMAELEEKAEALAEKSDTEWFIEGFDSSYAGRGSEVFQSIEEYCGSIVDSTDIGWLSDYGQQIANSINIRNSVVAGVA